MCPIISLSEHSSKLILLCAVKYDLVEIATLLRVYACPP